jgi:hypothetical protein
MIVAETVDWQAARGVLVYPEDLLPPRPPRISVVE